MFSREKGKWMSVGRADVSMTEIRSCTLGHYFLHSHSDNSLPPSGGYEVEIFGNTDGTYDLAGKEVKKPNYRMHVKIVTHSHDTPTVKGSIGWAKFHENYLEAVILLPSENVRDFVREVRHRGLEGLRVGGDCNDQGVVAVDMFVFYPPDGTDELLT